MTAFAEIRSTADIRQVITADLGPPLRYGRWACPFHDGDGPNFAITPREPKYKCHKCGVSGDVVDYLVNRERITVAEALRRLGGKAPMAPGTPIRHADGRSRGQT